LKENEMAEPTAGIAAAAISPQQARKNAQLANLAKGRATAAANRTKAAQSDAPEAPARAGLGVSAARQAQKAGTVVGHTEHGRVIVIGRDGRPISRKGDRNIDKFAIPKEEIPVGWSYQWICETVLNEPQTASLLDFQQKQWTPVPQDRHPTRPVRQGGLMLVERPQVLTDEARQEEMQEARDQVKANVEQFAPPGGLQKTGRIRKGRPVSVSGDGVPEPTLELADD
jgi:hypothetical protein